MNLSPRWVDFLTDAGWETVHWSVLAALGHLTFEIEVGALLSVGPRQTRVRMLPVKNE